MFAQILGIDPGLTRCGYGLISLKDRGQAELLSNGVLTTPKENMLSDRLKEMHDDLSGVILEMKPDSIALERVFFQSNVSSAMSVAQVSGMVQSIAASLNISVFEYTPTQIKNTITGDGQADKRQIQEMVVRMLKLNKIPEPPDAADALAVALTHSLFHNFSSNNDEKKSDDAIYNGSKLHDAIANAISSQNLMRQKDTTNSVKKNIVSRSKLSTKEGLSR